MLLGPGAGERYVAQVATKEADGQQRLRRETEKLPDATMQLGPDQGAFLAWLAQLIRARYALEIGTFTGFSALTVAMALPTEGRLVACDISEEWASIGKPYWKEAGVAEKIDLRIGPAAAHRGKLKHEVGQNSVDFAFIDADKPAYCLYYAPCLGVGRSECVIVLYNGLRVGNVANHQLNEH